MYKSIKFFPFVFLIIFNLNAAVLDSTGVEKKAGRVFVLHKVDPKETLFALSRRYSVSVDEIKKENPEVESGLQINQIVKIPVGTYEENTPAQSVKTSSSSGKTHEIKAKETLYGISRMYGISVDDLKKANPGVDVNDLQIGQVIVVSASPASTTTNVVTVNTTTASVPVESKPKEEVSKPVPAPKPERRNDIPLPQWKPGEKINETGIAEIIEDNSETPKYLALHKYAPIGTIMQVTNEANSVSIFVRVIGNLPNTGANDKTIVKISKKAFQKLSPTDKRVRVQLSFIP